MNSIKKTLFILSILFTQLVDAQYYLTDSIQLSSDNISFLKTNNFGDILLIVDDNELLKIDENHNISRFPLKKIVTHLDTNLSLKTGVVYNFQELEILDDQLNPIQDKINFSRHQIFPSAVSISDSQILWYFDPIEQRLVQWNYQLGKVLLKSNPIYFKENDTTISAIHQTNNRIFLISQHWIYEYDIFGNFKTEIALEDHIYYTISDNYIFLNNSKQITKINLLNQEISSFDNFFNGKDFTMKGDQLFAIKNKGLYIYTRIKK